MQIFCQNRDRYNHTICVCAIK